jgi:gliding motility-associated-like protein
MKKALFIAVLSILSFETFANHTKGGWMYYQYLGPGSSANTVRYRITLKLYTACALNTGQFDATINFTFFDGGTNQSLFNVPVTYTNSIDVQNCSLQECHPCINFIPVICYKITTYETEQELPRTANGYTIAYQRCCRISSIINLQPPSNNVGETWTVTIPGTAVASGAEMNSSARFSQNDTAIICKGGNFIFDFSASDTNNDSLVYSFTDAFAGGSNGSPIPNPASNPPYSPVSYSPGFSGSQPMGSGVNIDRKTGMVTGIAPQSGIYVLTVTVSEYKRGTTTLIGRVRKSLHIEVTDCSLTEATLDPEYISCDGFTVTFVNHTPDNIQTYDWDFGDGNTSSLPSPTHTYADTGVYILKLVVNRGQACSDSTTSPVRVFPGFGPDFSVAGKCTNTAIQFNDITTAAYGVVNSWNWNFGDLFSPTNTSSLQHPTHTYTKSGTYDVQFVVTSSKGCRDTVRKTIDIYDKPELTLTNDTLICYIDTLQLNAVGEGTFNWTPNYMISNTGIGSPLVSPDVPTTYYVTLTDPFGCVVTDSVYVNVKLFVTLSAANDSTICQGDPTLLRINSDALHYLWTEIPAGNTLNDPTLKNPTATPLNPTRYHVLANIGKCTAEEDITLTTVPYPRANAGADQLICLGNSTQLQASGGSIYSWSPTAFLNAANIPNPVVTNPTDNVRYIVTVRDVLGCPKPVKDTMILTVANIKADAGPRDTSVVVGQPLQLQATGSTNFSWTPSTWLNNPSISDPISTPLNNIEYVVRVSNSVGCFDTDSILVKVYRVKPGFYVPTAFSPNHDGLNDIFRPVAIGMKSVDVFRVYNRWGQMLYSGTGNNIGWDGTFGGRGQETATYVWHAEGVDYLNNRIKQKGYVVLIR